MKNESINKRIKHREDMFLRRLFGIMAKMAKVDGKVDAWEAHAAEGAFARFPRAMARRKFCVSVFNSSKNGRTPLHTLAAEFEKEWASPEDCLAVYELLWDYECPASVIVYMNPVRWSIRHFVKALADGDAKALAEHVQLPFERRYPSGLRQLYQRRRTVSSDSELLWSSRFR